MITRSRTKKTETTVSNEREMSPPDIKKPRVDLVRQKFVKVKDKDQDNENQTIQSPVFNIHIHVSPTVGENLPVSSMPSIQPIIHLHFDEISKNLGLQEKDVSKKSSKLKSKINSMLSVANTSSNEVLNFKNSKTQKKIADKINGNLEIKGLNQQNEKKSNPVINNTSSKKKCKTIKEVGQSIVLINEFNDSISDKNKNVDPSPHFKDKNKNKFDNVEKLNDLGQSTSTDVNIYSAEELPHNLKKAVVLLKDIFGRNISNGSLANVSHYKNKEHECNSTIENKINESDVDNENENVIPLNEENSLYNSESSERHENIKKFFEPSKILNINSQDHVPNHLNNRSKKSKTQQVSSNEIFQELNNKECSKVKNSLKNSEILETPKTSKCLNMMYTNGKESSNEGNKNVSTDDQALLFLTRRKGDVYSEIYKSDNEEDIFKNNSLLSITEGCNFSEILKKIQNEKYRNQILSFANQQSTALQKVCSKETTNLENLQKKKESSSQKKEEKTQCYSTRANNEKHKNKIIDHEFKSLDCSTKAQITCNDCEADDKNEDSSDENEKSCNEDGYDTSGEEDSSDENEKSCNEDGYDTSGEDEDTALKSQHNNATIGSKNSDQTLDLKSFSEKEIVSEFKKKKKKLKVNDEKSAESTKNSSTEKSLSIESKGEIHNTDISLEQIGKACNEITDFEIICQKLSELQDGCGASKIIENRLIEVATPEIQLECIKKEMVRRGISNVSIKKKAHKKKINKFTSQFRSPKSDNSSIEPKKRDVSKPKKKEISIPETPKPSKKKISSQEDYIPLKASGPTKFAAVPLDKIKPYEKHDAMSFKEKMLFGNRIKRFGSSKELQKLKMKQQIKKNLNR